MSEPPKAIHRYEIVERLGQGGMGELYLASDPLLDRLVAIKVLRAGFDSPELRERFTREARSAARLAHTNIVTIYDIGTHNDEPFIAMEYVPGDTLHQKIRRRVELSLATKLRYADELCAGLAHAHHAGIIHRDIKPANLIIASTGTLKILDFGLARFADSSITQSGVVMGTLNYMSPEQISGQPLDPRSDMFAVGAVLYELLSSRQAFPGGIDTGVLGRITSGTPTPLEELCPGLDPDLVRIVEKAIAKSPADRFDDLDAMRDALAGVRERAPTTSIEAPIAKPRRDSPPAPPVQGGALSDQAQHALVRDQIREWMRKASAELGLGNLPAARQFLASIETLDPGADEARRIRTAILHLEARTAAGAPTEIAAAADEDGEYAEDDVVGRERATTAELEVRTTTTLEGPGDESAARATTPPYSVAVDQVATTAPHPAFTAAPAARRLSWVGPLAGIGILALAGVVGLRVLNSEDDTPREATVAAVPAPSASERVAAPAASPPPAPVTQTIAAPPVDAAQKPPSVLGSGGDAREPRPAAGANAVVATKPAENGVRQGAMELRDESTRREASVKRPESPAASPPDSMPPTTLAAAPVPPPAPESIPAPPDPAPAAVPESSKPVDVPAANARTAAEPDAPRPAPAPAAPAPTVPLSPARPVSLASFRSGSEKITFAQRGSGALESKAESCEIRVFQESETPPPFVDLGVINYHEERHRTRAGSLTLEAALPKLKATACKVGADAIVNVRVTDVRRLEFAMFNVRATAVRLTR